MVRLAVGPVPETFQVRLGIESLCSLLLPNADRAQLALKMPQHSGIIYADFGGSLFPRQKQQGMILPINDRSYRKCAGAEKLRTREVVGRRTFDKTVSSKPLAFCGGRGSHGY